MAFTVDIYRLEFYNSTPVIGTECFSGNLTVITDDYSIIVGIPATDGDAFPYSLAHILNNLEEGNYQCCYKKESMGYARIYGGGQPIYDYIYWEQADTKAAPQFSHDDSDITINVVKLTTGVDNPTRDVGKSYPLKYKAYFDKAAWIHWDSSISDEANRLEMLSRLSAGYEGFFNDTMYRADAYVEPGSLRSDISYIEDAGGYYVFEYTLLALNWSGIKAHADYPEQWNGAIITAPTYVTIQEEFDTLISASYVYEQGVSTPTRSYCRLNLNADELTPITGSEIVDSGSTWRLTINAETSDFTITIGETKKEVYENFISYMAGFTNVSAILSVKAYTAVDDLRCEIHFLCPFGATITFINLTGTGSTSVSTPTLYDNVTITELDNIKPTNVVVKLPTNDTNAYIAIGSYSTANYAILAANDIGVKALIADFNSNVGSHYDIRAYFSPVLQRIYLAFTSTANTILSGDKTPLAIYIGSDQNSASPFITLVYSDGNTGTINLGIVIPPIDSYSLHAVNNFQIIPPIGIRITGFKTRSLSELVVQGQSYSIPFEWDSNDIAAYIRTKLIASGDFGTSVGTLEETTRAQAEINFDVTFNVRSFDGSVPSLTLTQDGTTLWDHDAIADVSSSTISLLAVEGLYAARGRLGYWDRSNLLGWSSYNVLSDFTPSSTTRANQLSVKAVKGKIVKCIGYDNGFIVYATGNIVRAEYVGDQYTFRFRVIEAAEGVVDPRHIASYKNLHYYWGTKGLTLLEPESAKVSLVLPELADWINKYRYPITISLLSSRWLIIYLQDRARRFSNRDIRLGKSEITAAPQYEDGSPREIAPAKHGSNLYPLYKRALVYDSLLQKWGTADLDMFGLASMSPVNQPGYQVAKDYELTAAMIHNLETELLLIKDDAVAEVPFVRGFNVGFSDGFQQSAGIESVKSYIANTFPVDSYVLFGHYSTHRTRSSKISRIDTEFVNFPEAEIELERSLDGATIEWTETFSEAVTDLKSLTYPNITGKWLNMLVKGTYHLKRLLVRGQSYGR